MEVNKPVPETESEREQEFWERMTAGEVCVQHCTDCGANAYPPRLYCPECYSRDWEFQEISGEGEVYGYTAIHRPSRPAYEDELPVVSAIVELPEGPRIMGKVRGDIDDISVGTTVELDSSTLSEDNVRLVFEPTE